MIVLFIPETGQPGPLLSKLGAALEALAFPLVAAPVPPMPAPDGPQRDRWRDYSVDERNAIYCAAVPLASVVRDACNLPADHGAHVAIVARIYASAMKIGHDHKVPSSKVVGLLNTIAQVFASDS